MNPQIRLEIRSNPLLLCGVRELLSCVAARLGFGDEACTQIKLASDEALCNVIRHGYDREPDHPIWVEVSWETAADGRGALRIIIEDEARQVEPGAIKGRDLDDIRPGGLGVHIIRQVMDEVTYEKRDGKGMKLTMVKRRSEPGRPASQGGCRGERDGADRQGGCCP